MTPEVPHLRPVTGASAQEALAQPEHEAWDGVTRPARQHPGPRFLTDVIVELGLVPRERVDEAVEVARQTGATPERVLLDSGILSPDAHSRAVAERHGLDHLDLNVYAVDLSAAALLPAAAAKRYLAIPVAFSGERALTVAMADPANVLAIDDVALMTGYEVRPAVASTDDILGLVSRLTRLEDVVTSTEVEAEDEGAGPAEVVDLRETADDAPVIKLVNQIVAQAVE